MKKVLLLFALLLSASLTWATITVTGVITSAEDGEPVIGASVLEKGTSNGTITDIDGVYTLTVADKATLVVSYVGMKTQELRVSGVKHNIVLRADAIALEETVVTAMGVKQEKKRLNFAVQNVNSDDLTESKSANFIDALQGKVAGVNVTNSGGSPNSGSQIVLRGITSISSTQSNNPLIVLDGMPLTGSAGDINPNDIESVTVLKGAAASALYGQEAANGVLMITTKAAQVGKVQATVNASWQFDTPANLIRTQMKYLPGSNGFYREKTKNGMGPVVTSDDVLYDNVRNYFKDYGFYHKYDLNVTGGSEKFKGMASASYSKADGIVPNDYREKVTALVKGDFSPNKYITIGMMGNVIHNRYRGAGSISGIYSWPINDDITKYLINMEGGYTPDNIRFLYYDDTKKTASSLSPLFSRYADQGENKSTRTLLQGFVVIKPVKGLDITARLSMDQNNYHYDGYSVPRFDDMQLADSTNTDAYRNTNAITQKELDELSKSSLGEYSTSMSESRLITALVMAQYHADLPLGFGLDAMLGAEFKDRKSISTNVAGRDFIIPGVYSMANVSDHLGTGSVGDANTQHSHTRKGGVYGEIRADYKGLATLSATARWDWSSTLVWDQSPYFYPSVTAGLIFSELFGWNDTRNNWFSYGKLRGNFAMVGKDAPPYLFDRRFTQFATLPDGGYSTYASYTVGFNLVPEMSTSWEIGADLRFFDNRTRLDLAYYSMETANQIVTVRVPLTTGHVLQTRNEGTVRNRGFEFTLEQDIIRRNGWLWTAGLNFGLNRGYVVDLPDDMQEIEGSGYTDLYPTAFLHGSTTAISGKDYLRTEDGRIICDENGYPQINPTKSVLIGNREPVFMSGLTTSLKYKGWTLSALFEGRVGGDVVNITGRSMLSNGMSTNLEFYRGRQVVWDGVVQTGTDANGNPVYEQNTKPIVLDPTTINNYYYAVSSNFLEKGSYIRLQYVTLTYDFKDLLKNVKGINDIKLSLTGNNLFLITRYTGSDPQINSDTDGYGTGASGIDYFAVPQTRSYSLSFQMQF